MLGNSTRLHPGPAPRSGHAYAAAPAVPTRADRRIIEDYAERNDTKNARTPGRWCMGKRSLGGAAACLAPAHQILGRRTGLGRDTSCCGATFEV